MAKKYSYQAYPTMMYHPVTGHYAVFNKKEDVPDGWVSDPKEIEGFVLGKELPKATLSMVTEATAASVKAAKKTPAKKPAAKKASAKASSPLDAMDLSRADAEAILKEEGIEFAEDATDADLAKLVSEFLDEE